MTETRSRIWSWGGGVQTIAILVLIAQGHLPKPELAIMADTSRERSSTWRYFHQYAKPLLNELNIPFIVASHDLAKVDLYAHNGDLLLPAFTQSGRLSTFCSSKWKQVVIRRKLRLLEYGTKKPVLLWIGMSLDEIHRLRVSDVQWVKHHYPLIFDIKKRRHECIKAITNFGLPEPPNSSCWMCPNMRNKEWQQVKNNDPDDWKKAVLLGHKIRAKDKHGGVFLHRSRVPLDQADLTIKEAPLPLLECADTCWT